MGAADLDYSCKLKASYTVDDGIRGTGNPHTNLLTR